MRVYRPGVPTPAHNDAPTPDHAADAARLAALVERIRAEHDARTPAEADAITAAAVARWNARTQPTPARCRRACSPPAVGMTRGVFYADAGIVS